jgi:hypothetical protein
VQFPGVACVFGRFYYSAYARYTYLNLVLNFFLLRVLRVWYQQRRVESIVRRDHYDRLSGNQWKERSGLV